MDYLTAFNISETGMVTQKTILDTVALNLANINTTRSANGGVFRPLEVILGEKTAASFASQIDKAASSRISSGVEVVDIAPLNVKPRLSYEPHHPDANKQGFVEYPGVNPVSEMVKMMESTRAYEANIKALNAAKTMALKALEIGGR